MFNSSLIKLLSVALATSILAACGGGGADFTGGSSGGNGSTTTSPTTTPAHVSILSSTPTINSSVASTATATLTVTVTDANFVVVKGATVSFSADKGALIVNSAITDANGNAVATVSQGSASVGDTITVTAAVVGVSGVSTQAGVKVAATSTSPSAIPAHISAVSSSATINSASASAANAKITVTVTDTNNVAVSGVTVDFSADKGALAVNSPTTDVNGNATATVTQGSASVGDIINVTAAAAGVTGVSTSVTVKVIATSTAPSATPVHVSIASSSPTINGANSSTASSTIAVTVTDINNVAVSGATVVFTANGGALVVNSSTTDASGSATATLTQGSSNGGDTITVTANVSDVSGLSTNIDIAVTATPVLRLGIFNTSGHFVANTISIGQTPLAAAGSSGLAVDIVDTANGNALYQGSASVTFTSACQSSGSSQISSPIVATTGIVNSTYVAKGCSGSDVITATAVVGTSTLPTATGTINVQAAALGGIKFVSATPGVIGLQGTGQNTASTVAFTVVDASGNPVQGASVTFSLSTSIGGITFTPATAISDVNGNAQTTINAGTVHTPVQVIATTTSGGITKTTQSNNLIISIGKPAQNGFSLSASTLNIEGNNIDGQITTITARLSDRYGNPVPDGTPVSFVAECGHVDANCSTTNSACSVTYTSQSPRTHDLLYPPSTARRNMNTQANADDYALGNDDHRCSVLAYSNGEESFVDSNGNGLYDTGEFFVSRPEAFVDSNENQTFDLNSGAQASDETFIDFNSDTVWNNPVNTLFVGLLCNLPANSNPASPGTCPGGSSLNVFQNIPIVLSSGTARIGPATSPNTAVSVAPAALPSLSIPISLTKSVTVLVTDTAGQIMPAGTKVSVTTSYGTVNAPILYTVGSTSDNTVATDATTGKTYPLSISGETAFTFSITAPATSGTGTATVSVTSPSGVITISQFSVTN